MTGKLLPSSEIPSCRATHNTSKSGRPAILNVGGGDIEKRIVHGDLLLFLCLITQSLMTHGEVDIQLHIFLTSALYEDEWSVLYFGRFIRGQRALSIN